MTTVAIPEAEAKQAAAVTVPEAMRAVPEAMAETTGMATAAQPQGWR
ncbi:hypothetical protein [Mesorhizobium sp.]|nr:hypothetical protein [Mesorhizobium sp.]